MYGKLDGMEGKMPIQTPSSKKIMLYCPKCKTKYDDGTQRFCNNDGGRLLPAVAVNERGAPNQVSNGNVFTSILQRTSATNERDEQLSTNPRFVKAETRAKKSTGTAPASKPESGAEHFTLPEKSRVFRPERNVPRPSVLNRNLDRGASAPRSADLGTSVNFDDDILEVGGHGFQAAPPRENETRNTHQTVPRPIMLDERIVNQAELGNRETDPSGRNALNWRNPRAIVGQYVKGRYLIADILHKDQMSIAYLGEDRAIKGKRVVVRVMMSKDARESFQERVFAEERISLSHVNHPNVLRVIDSAELQEGNPYIVTDFVDGVSVDDLLAKSEKVNPMRTARIIRQASLALSEVHQSGILHRNLMPQHLLLRVGEAGVEQVKVTDFAVSDGKPQIDNLAFKAPEQLMGEMPTSASDTFSLAGIAYRMLTGIDPFPHETEKELLKSEKEGLKFKASELVPGLPSVVDDIFDKGLAFNPADRYLKSRDFGEALFNAIAPAQANSATATPAVAKANDIAPPAKKVESEKPQSSGVASDLHIPSTAVLTGTSAAKDADHPDVSSKNEGDSDDSTAVNSTSRLKKRTAEQKSDRGWLVSALSVLGVLILATLAFGGLYYFLTRSERLTNQAQVQPEQKKNTSKSIRVGADETAENFISPPPEQEIVPPEGYIYFESKKADLSKQMQEGYRGFSVYYPQDWTKTNSPRNYLDVKKEDKNGIPREQFLVTKYASKGTYAADKDDFPSIATKSNKELAALFNGNFEEVDESPITLSTGWKGYQVKFKTKQPVTVKGRDVEFWGRRIWIPPARPGVGTGFVITMLATSTSNSVKSLDDVGIEGELGNILKTFNPVRNYD